MNNASTSPKPWSMSPWEASYWDGSAI